MAEEQKPEPRYRLTPLGVLVGELGEEQGEQIWQCLRSFAQVYLDYNEERGIPCIVMDGGGAIIAVRKEEGGGLTTPTTDTPASTSAATPAQASPPQPIPDSDTSSKSSNSTTDPVLALLCLALLFILPVCGATIVSQCVLHLSPFDPMGMPAGLGIVLVVTAALFWVASMLIEAGKARTTLQRISRQLLAASPWLFLAVALQGLAEYGEDLYAAPGGPPLWLDCSLDILDWIAPAPIAVAFYVLFSSAPDSPRAPETTGARSPLPRPYDSARN